MMDPHPNPAAAAAGADESTDKPSSTSEQDKKVSSSDSSPRSATDYVPYPKIDPKDVDPPPPPADGWGTFVMGSQSEHSGLPPSSLLSPGKTVHWSAELTKEAEYTNKPPPVGTMPSGRNPYISSSPATAPVAKNTMDNVKDVLGKWGKKVGEATKKTEDLAGNVWQHLKTGPSVVDTAMGRIAQGTKVIAEGGYEKIFRQTFETQPEEQLRKTYACYLSTSAGPVIGTLYLSSAKLAFCSDNPLSYKVGDQTEWSYYKVVIPVHQLRSVNSSASKTNSAEKYIQVASVDNHEFWFMGFVNYDSAVKYLQDVVKGQTSEAV